MKLKDVICVSASLLHLDDVVDVLEDKVVDNQYTSPIIECLTNLCNLVTGELSSSYIPLVRADEVRVINNKISMTALQKRPTKIINVYDINGNPVQYTSDATTIYVNINNARVQYNYVAEKYKLSDDVGFTEQEISKVVLAYGVCAEYCLTERRFEEAVMWHQRFVDGVKQRVVPKNVKTSARRWE